MTIDPVSAVNEDGTLDMDARYQVDSWPAIAVRLLGWNQISVPIMLFDDEDEDWTGETGEYEVVDDVGGMVRVVMVGDDRVHLVDVDDLTKLHEDICECGQIGCGWA